MSVQMEVGVWAVIVHWWPEGPDFHASVGFLLPLGMCPIYLWLVMLGFKMCFEIPFTGV
jgi:hypothetical protein